MLSGHFVESLEPGKHFQLKVSLSDAELLSVLEEHALLHGATADLHGSLLDVDDKTPRRERNLIEAVAAGGKSEITALFTTERDAIILTGMLHDRFPIYFVLKPNSATYKNFLRLLVRELHSVGLSERDRTATVTNSPSHTALSGLASFFEARLRAIHDDTQRSVYDMNEIIEIYGDDLELNRGQVRRAFGETGSPLPKKTASTASVEHIVKIAGKASGKQERPVLDRYSLPTPRKFRLHDQSESGATLVSGFLSLEIQELPSAEPSSSDEQFDLLRSSLVLVNPLAVDVTNGVTHEGKGSASSGIRVTCEFRCDPTLSGALEMFVHWGRRGERWIDDEVSRNELRETEKGTFQLSKEIYPEVGGVYGLTFYLRIEGSKKTLWLSELNVSDTIIELPARRSRIDIAGRRTRLMHETQLRGDLLHSLTTFDRFNKFINQQVQHHGVRGIEKLLFDISSQDAELRQLLAEYYSLAVLQSSRPSSDPTHSRFRNTLLVLQNLGIGEVVLVAPEGPAAIAGGVAQVIIGLSEALARHGLSVTLITPLYESAQGSKHHSAETVLREGIRFRGKQLPIREVGEIPVQFGPTYISGTEVQKRAALRAATRVYLAEDGRFRIFLLRHSRLADRLYPSGTSDDQLQRAIFLSRGALEIMRDERFGISPNIIVSNDWLAAPVPFLLNCDPRYQRHEHLHQAKTMHVVHNCGHAYQGCFYVNQQGEDLWPLFGVEPSHFFGVADPQNRNLINLTAGAIFHTKGALLTVSKPYAEQLLRDRGADGLEHLIRSKQDRLFGISNGVDLSGLRRMFCQLGEAARSAADLAPLISGRVSDKKVLKHLVRFKHAIKSTVQERYGLERKESALLLSFVGRLAEQKGVSLLTSSVGLIPGNGAQLPSVLEETLERCPDVQIFVGGPPSPNDPAVQVLADLLRKLELRYPGRVRAVFDFIPHQDALQITAASDLFLMPSRYEPGGITQLEALAAGTMVVARNVGGISATLTDYRDLTDEGNSFLFEDYSAKAFRDVLFRAIAHIRNGRKRRKLVARAALAEHDWAHRIPQHLALLQYVAGVLDPVNSYPHLDLRNKILQGIRPAFIP